MDVVPQQYPVFILFFSFFTFSVMGAEHAHIKYVAPSGYQTHMSNYQESRSHHDFFYTIRTDPNFSGLPVYQHQFNRYTAHDFREHFTARGYTENQILHQRCLYMFDEFVKFVQTYSAYRCTIQQLHAELKNLNCLQKAYYIAKGTYCVGLQKRIQFLYNELNTIKTAQPHNNTILPYRLIEPCKSAASVFTDHSLEIFHEQQSEYSTLASTYHMYVPSLANAITQRLDAYNNISTINCARYTTKSYIINNHIKQLLSKHGYDTTQFNACFGNTLHHAVHQESLDILDRIDRLPTNSMLHDHQDALVDFTVALVSYNHEGLTDKATQIADLCWTLLDCGQAVIEGAALGIYSTAHDMITHPIETSVCIVAGRQVLAYHLCKVLYNVADIALTAVIDRGRAQKKWNSYTAPLNNIIDAIHKKEISLRDVIKGGTVFVVGLKAQSKLLGGLGKFCNTIKQKSINFIHNNPRLKPQNYLTTPEGLLFEATSQSNKLKQSGEAATVSNLKNVVEKRLEIVWNSIKPTDPMYPGTKIPKSFELTIGKQKFWVCPNSTEHMLEYIQGKIGQHKKIITHNMPMNSQALLTSFKSAVEQAVSHGIQYDTMITIGCWEFRFGMPRKDGLLPTIYHANFKPQNWQTNITAK